MARQVITVTVATHAGVTYPTPQSMNPTLDAEIDDNDGRIILIIDNVSTSARVVTIRAAATYGDPPIPLEDQVISLSPGASKMAGPFAANLFNQAGDSSTRAVLVDIDGSLTGDIQIVGIQVPIAVS